MKFSIFTFIIFQKKVHWQKENETLKSELLVLKNQMMQCESSDVMERNVATQCDEEMLARDMAEQENSFHKLTDEYKLSLGTELEKNFYLPSKEGNCFAPQNLSNLGQKNPECVSLYSTTTTESCFGLKMKTDVAELESKTKIGAEQGSASANCGQNVNEDVASHLIADEMLVIKVCLMLH